MNSGKSLLGKRAAALMVVAFLSSAIIWPLSMQQTPLQATLSWVLVTSVVLAAASQVMLFFRYRAAPSLPRFYTKLALWIFVGMCTIFWILPISFAGTSATSVPAFQAWGLFLSRLALGGVLLVASINLEHIDRDQGVGNRAYAGWVWISSVAALLVLIICAFIFPLPRALPLGVIQQPHEVLGLGVFIACFVLTIRQGSWTTHHFAYGMAWLYLLQSIASLFFLFAGSSGTAFSLAGSIAHLGALLTPLVAMQSKMFGLYRASEEHRLKKSGKHFGVAGSHQKLDGDIFRHSVEQSQDPLYIANNQGEVIFINEGFTKMTGFELRDVRSKTPDTWSHKSEGQQNMAEILSQVRVRKEPYSGTRWNRRKDGSTYESNVLISPVVDEFGEVAWFVVREHDLTEGRERTLMMQQIMDNMPIGICLIESASTKIVLSNQYADMLLTKAGMRGISELQTSIDKLCEIGGSPYPQEKIPFLEVLQSKEGAARDDIEVACTEGEEQTMIWKMHATPLFDAKGEINQILVAMDDITHQKKMEHKMTDAISVASHQLRTPLTGIKWAVDELRKGEEFGASKEDKIAIFDTLYDATVRMFNVVQGLLDVSKLEQGTIEIKPEPLSLEQLIGEVVQELKPRIDQKKITVKQSTLSSIPVSDFDVLLVRQVVQNLLDNAVKYTPENGEIDSILSIDKNRIQWALHDTGIGIPKEELDHLFEKFHRGDNAQKVDAYGMGLGLYTVKFIMDMLGGEVRCESEVNNGTTFHVFFPIQKSENTNAAPSEQAT